MDMFNAKLYLLLLECLILASLVKAQFSCDAGFMIRWSGRYGDRASQGASSKTYNDKTVEECKTLCLQHNPSQSFECKSIDYNVQSKICRLETAVGTGSLKSASGWDFYYLRCVPSGSTTNAPTLSNVNTKGSNPTKSVTTSLVPINTKGATSTKKIEASTKKTEVSPVNTDSPTAKPIATTKKATATQEATTKKPTVVPTATPPGIPCTFQIEKGNVNLPNTAATRTSIANQIATKAKLSNSRVTVTSLSENDKDHGVVNFRITDDSSQNPRACDAMHEFRKTFPTSFTWGNNPAKPKIEDTLSCGTTCYFTSRPVTSPPATTPVTVINTEGSFRIKKGSGDLSDPNNNFIKKSIESAAQPGILFMQITISSTNKATGEVKFMISHRSSDPAEMDGCQLMLNMEPRIYTTARIDWSNSYKGREVEYASFNYKGPGCQSTPLPPTNPTPTPSAGSSANPTPTSGNTPTPVATIKPVTTPGPAPTTPREYIIYGSFSVVKPSNDNLGNSHAGLIKEGIRQLALPGVDLTQILLDSADKNTGKIVFGIKYIDGSDTVDGCKAMKNIENVKSPKCDWNYGNRDRPLVEDSLTYSHSCSVQPDGAMYRASFRISNPDSNVIQTESLLESLELQLADLADLETELDRVRIVTKSYSNTGTITFDVAQNSFHDVSSCVVITRINFELTKGAQLLINNVNKTMAAGTFVEDSGCNEVESLVEVLIRFGELNFTNAYQDPTSDDYYQLQKIVEDWLDGAFENDAELKDEIKRIDLIKFSSGSVVAEVDVAVSGDVKNPGKKVQDASNNQLKKDNGMIGGHKADPITATEIVDTTSAPFSTDDDDKILGLKVVYVIVIGLGIVIVLLIGIAIIAILTVRTRRELKEPFANQEDPEDKVGKEEEEKEQKKKKRSRLFSKKKKEKKTEENEYVEPNDKDVGDDDDDPVHNRFSEVGEGLPY